ncbi:Urea active transporter-like protein 1 [Chondrus crispus]|uniref:Urea active transporter-like protein 1 n=1 Tax=Chondrus crispus TaxID=2769 RepID=R7QHY4_CHOCR|nr:Urea active transporter-like protein 1 [Chondrus crispus]CDF37071.1 Urea active transporter-like protein 1 [Chondrus crispus]|eukprot:XP_005716890.1 Urea active transporter-like protein 1 [Chondrus crispus]
MATATAQFNVSAIGCPDDNTTAIIRNYFNVTEYRCLTRFFGSPPLSTGVGYAVVLAFGLAFGIATVALVYADQYFFRRTMSSEYFNTAGRSVRTGLTAAVIVSQWTWAATLLQSSNVAFQYGVSGPLWYAVGASVQVVLFSMMAVLVKLRAPTAHTFLEIVRARWGTVAHIIFMVFALLTNVIVTSLLILGASDTVQALTGVDVDIASVLIPLGVIMYTLAGGLKATFVASYFNTAIILISLVIFLFKVYVTSEELGSPDKVYDLLEQVATVEPVPNNRDGSYLTLFSRNGFFFGLVNLVGNFGTVFIDQSYWQSAIAATPSASWKGYLLGGLCWFAIPFSLATSLGLAAVARSLPITDAEADKGLVPPAAAKDLMGNGGASLILVMLFMAVTSSGASEQIAVSSLIAYDVYRTYINPNCSGRRIIFISRIVILTFGLFMGVFGIALHHIGVNLNFLYLAMGVFIGPAVVPVAYSICWGRASARGAICGALIGLVCGLSVWFGYGSTFDGGITIVNLNQNEVMLAGNLASIVSSGVICTVLSLLSPDDCDWSTTRAIALIEDDPNAHIPFETEESLERALKRIGVSGIVITIVLVLCWPALTLPVGVFSKGYFKFWVIISFIWGIVSCCLMVIMPLIESRNDILVVLSMGRYANRPGKNEGDGEESLEDFVVEDR